MIYPFRQFTKTILDQELLLFHPKKNDDIAVALVYPNCYEVGISNLGFQTVFRLLNQLPGTYAERAFIYPPPFAAVARTLESNRLLSDFDCLAFSVAFELDLLHLVRILQQAGIPVLAHDRSSGDYPLIVAGGIVMFMNPIPAAPFLDVIFIGEAEGLLENFTTILVQARRDHWTRAEILQKLAGIKGLYVPVHHDPARFESIERNYRPSISGIPNTSAVLTQAGTFKDMYLIEAGRGCPRGCRFCAAGYVYRPYRVNTLRQIENTVNSQHWKNRPVGVVGSAVSDYKELPALLEWIIKQQGKLGISSFRIDELNSANIELFERGGLRSISVAPEAGSERMRRVIHKPVSEQEIVQGTRLVARSRIQNLKLYFMLGLPFEREQDLQALVDLAGAINEIYNEKGSTGSVKISCNAFVPKAFTPFQWSRMAEEEEIEHKRNYLRRQFKKFNKISFSPAKSTREDILQGILSRGDERLAGLMQMLGQGMNDWKKKAAEIGFEYRSFLHHDWNYQDRLPWDLIKGPVPKEYLWREWQRAREEAGSS
jgi:radical SAM superfamily enzyme YgiQ (UPF0313 family)